MFSLRPKLVRLLPSLLGLALVGASCRGESPPPSPLQLVERAVGPARIAPTREVVATSGGYALLDADAPGRLGEPLTTTLPSRADEPVRFQVAADVVGLRREGASPSAARLERGVVIYDDAAPGVTSLWLGQGQASEELLLVAREHAPLRYELDLPAGLHLVRGENATARIEDEAGTPQLHLAATEAWDAQGTPVAVKLSLAGTGFELTLGDVTHWPVVVDPIWLSAAVPIQLRQNHTATVMGDGSVWLVGGFNGGALATFERFDPLTGQAKIIGQLDEPRNGHSSTVLQDGRLFVAGGTSGPSTVLVDPETLAVTQGPAMSGARNHHAGIRLLDGRVLIAGGGEDSVELFDPTSDSFGSPIAVAFGGASVMGARLTSGKVLLVTSSAGFVFDPANDSVTPTANTPNPDLEPAEATVMPLADGRALVVGGFPCFSVGGPSFCSAKAFVFDPAGAGSFVAVSDSVRDRLGAAATRLPDGRVLLAGGDDIVAASEMHTAETFSPQSGTFTALPQSMNGPRRRPSATVLPTGEVLVVGGTQSGAELLQTARGRIVTGPNIDSGPQGRSLHSATRLADGRVLFAGGSGDTTRIYDPTSDTVVSGGNLTLARSGHSAVALADGRVLLVGGGTSATDLYDPVSATASAGASTQVARDRPALLRLPDDRVLVVGDADTTVEIYDPQNDSFDALSDTLQEGGAHAAALLPNGLVLMVGPQTADLFDPTTNGITPAASPGATYVTPDLRVLPTGDVLLVGGPTFAAELYDTKTGTFSFTGEQIGDRVAFASAPLVYGDVVITGGKQVATEPLVYDALSYYSRAAAPDGAFHDDVIGTPLRDHTATLLLDGRVVMAGGLACDEPQFCFPENPLRLFTPLSFGLGSVAISAAPASVTPDTAVTLSGNGFDAFEAGGDGADTSAAPSVVWQSDTWDVMVPGRVLAFDDTSISFTLPASAYAGAGHLRVIVAGSISGPAPVTLEVAPAGTPCGFDADCPSGFCADGVCCDSACDGPCDGCTAALKGSGDDGTCGAIPPGRFLDDGCFVTSGGPCDGNPDCDSGFCVDGLCCNELCDGQCEACDVDGSLGLCVPVSGPPHGARPACDTEPPADLCDTRICDGSDRETCAATVGPCDPYACTAVGCETVCVTDAECATGFHCEGDQCVAGSCEGAIATRPDGSLLDCSPYTCLADGTCRSTCADVSDCVAPFACNFEGRCVSRPPNDELSPDCGCRLPGAPTGPPAPHGIALLVLLGSSLWRRRRAALVGLGLLLVAPAAEAQPDAEAPPEVPSPEPDAPAGEAPAPEEAPPALSDAERKAKGREHFQKGITLIKERAWSEALAEFLASRELYPTRVATTNAAIAYRELRRFDESLAMYETLMREYGDMPAAEMEEVKKAVTELRGRVGSIDIDLTEPGATIVIDDVTRGTYPPPGPLRVSAGSHIIRVVKEGYEPFETTVDVAGGNAARVSAPLTKLTESGQLSVTETKGRTLVVLVDDVEVGQTPWSGRLSIGQHSVRLRGEDKLGTPPVAAAVKSQETTSLSLEASPLTAQLRIEPTPANAEVFIDAVTVGRGIWEGAMTAGPHQIEVREPGFLPASRKVELGDDQKEVLAIQLERAEEGITIPGDFTVDVAAVGMLAPNFGGDVIGDCGDGCDRAIGLGFMARLHLGYEFPFGLGLGVFGGYLVTSQEVAGRSTTVQPVGLESRAGTAADTVRLRGPLVGAFGSYLFDGELPVMLRLGAGPVFAQLRDARTGSFELDDGNTYQAGPIIQEPTAIYLGIFPEVRGGYRFNEWFTFTVGVEVPLLVALKRPSWDPAREIDAAVDGIGAYETEALTGRVVAAVALSLGGRVQF